MLVCMCVSVCLHPLCLPLRFLWTHLLDSSLVFTALPLNAAANDRKCSSLHQGRKAREDRGEKKVTGEG